MYVKSTNSDVDDLPFDREDGLSLGTHKLVQFILLFKLKEKKGNNKKH